MKSIFAVIVFAIAFTQLKAQAYSQWITDNNHPSLKVRYRTWKDSQGYNYLVLELQSSSHCKFSLTASLCSTDRQDRNGWQAVELFKDKTAQRKFKIMNACANGFWWWYRGYSSGAVRID